MIDLDEVERDARAFAARIDEQRSKQPPPPPPQKVEIQTTKLVQVQPPEVDQNLVIVQNPGAN